MILMPSRIGLLLAAAAMVVASGCGAAEAPVAQSEPDKETATSAGPLGTAKGAPISVPVCDFLGISAEQASQILGYGVTTTSDQADKDPSGGSCNYQPAVPSATAFEVTIAVFPDTTDGFNTFMERFAAKKSPTGNRLWTPPEQAPGMEDTYTFGSPDGGYDNVWVYDDGYRIMATDQNKTVIPGAADKVMAMAQAAAANVGGA